MLTCHMNIVQQWMQIGLHMFMLQSKNSRQNLDKEVGMGKGTTFYKQFEAKNHFYVKFSKNKFPTKPYFLRE